MKIKIKTAADQMSVINLCILPLSVLFFFKPPVCVCAYISQNSFDTWPETYRGSACSVCWRRRRRWGEAPLSCRRMWTPEETNTPQKAATRLKGNTDRHVWVLPSSGPTSVCSWALSDSSGLEEDGVLCTVWSAGEESGSSASPPPTRTEHRADLKTDNHVIIKTH